MKDIRYSGYSDLVRCKDEPIHLIGSVQDFGVLLVFSKKDKSLLYFSENAIQLFDLDKPRLENGGKGYALDYFLAMLGLNKSSILESDGAAISAKTVQYANTFYTICYTSNDDLIHLELEQGIDNYDGEKYFTQNQEFLKMLNHAEDFSEFSQLIAESIQKITDYDRVMVYRFDNEFNGEVYAEALKEGRESFLGLHYPHTDIPEQARNIYKKNKCRIIKDVNSAQIPMYGLGDNPRDLDISNSVLRSSSPIHLQYLQNMGVQATLTLSIMIDEQLWGLIACHHYSPKHIGHYKRLAAMLQTDFFASQIRRWERSDEYGLVQEKEHIYQAIIEDGIKHKNLFQAITNQTYLLGLTSSTGGAVIREGKVFSFGISLETHDVLAIQDFMNARNEHVFLTNEFGKYFEKYVDFKHIASGLLYYRLDIEGNSAIMWFRRQLAEGKMWGGNPLDNVDRNPLTPRNSFAAWEEEVEGKSAIWLSHEIQAGLRLCAFLEREIYINSLKEQKKRFELLTNELKEANEELNQFNWISSHDMKEPLRKIRLFVDQIKSEENLLSKTHQAYFTRIDAAAIYMQNLINDLLEYASLSKQENYTQLNLKQLIDEALYDLDESDVDVQIFVDEGFVVYGVKLHLKQMLINIFSNSVKFKSPDRQLKLQIRLERNYLFKENVSFSRLIISDNGIGFSPDFKEKIFKVFQRLHAQNVYKGTGIGLALCKKVMESHGGFIEADAEEGKGAEFYLFFKE
jgi:chemotaxis family two-component system sensor kinase Cph1